jgi:capsular polysaccharide biosynthesis protein
MELQHYLRIVRRSWPLVVGLPALVALLTLALWLALPQRYTITGSIVVTQRQIGTAGPQSILPDQNNRESWTASEFIVDDILQVVKFRRFAEDIAAWVRTQHGVSIDPERINVGLDADRQHRTIFLHATADRADLARWIVEGAADMLRQKGLAYWNRADSASLDVSATDLPPSARSTEGLSTLALNLVLRTILATILAIGLAFLRHYFDQSLHRQSEVEALGFEVVGTIPKDDVKHRSKQRK